MVIQEGRTRLHGVRHVHPVTAPGQDLALQHRLDPDVLGLIEGVASFELFRIQGLGNGLARGIVREGLAMGIREQGRDERRTGQPGLETTGGETHDRIEVRIIHLIRRQHRPLHQGIGLLQQVFPGLALLLRQVLETVQEHVAAEGRIATEELIGALPSHHHLVVDLVDVAAHQEFRHRQGVVDRALGVPEGALHPAVELLARETHHVLLGRRGVRHLLGDRRLVVAGVVETNGECLDRALADGGGQPKDGATVDASREVTTHGHIGDHPQLHRFEQSRTNRLDVVGLALAAVPLALAGEVHVPVLPGLNLEAPVAAAHADAVAGRHLMDPIKGRGPGDHGLHQLMEEPFRGEAALHRRMGKQHLQL